MIIFIYMIAKIFFFILIYIQLTQEVRQFQREKKLKDSISFEFSRATCAYDSVASGITMHDVTVRGRILSIGAYTRHRKVKLSETRSHPHRVHFKVSVESLTDSITTELFFFSLFSFACGLIDVIIEPSIFTFHYFHTIQQVDRASGRNIIIIVFFLFLK